VGKIDQFVFVKHLGSRPSITGEISQLDRYGVHSDSISSLIQNVRFLQESYLNLCRKARSIRARDVMQPITESISEDAPLQDAIDKMGHWQAISILVTRQNSVVGILRLSDVYHQIAEEVVRQDQECD
jgi:predicted transcriptional regulator